jgi:hypothetical protein
MAWTVVSSLGMFMPTQCAASDFCGQGPDAQRELDIEATIRTSPLIKQTNLPDNLFRHFMGHIVMLNSTTLQ